MKKILRAASLVLFVLVLIAILAFLYLKTQSIDSGQRAEISDRLRDLKQFDAEWNLDVLRSKVELNQNYDPVTSPQKAMLGIQDNLAEMSKSLDQAALKLAASSLAAAFEQKVDRIDAFKSQNSVLKNSLRFLPTATAQLQDQIAQLQDQIAQAKPANPGQAQALASLNKKATELLTDTLRFNLTPEATLRTKLEELTASLETDLNSIPEELKEPAGLIVSHGRMVLRQKDREDAILTEIAAVPTSQRIDQLGSAFERQFELKLREKDFYQTYLFAYTGFLLLVLGYAGYKLVQTFRAVRQANETLEKKVAERTNALSKTLGDLKESQAQVIQSEKMASLGQMVAGVAHEINTPLAYVKSGLDITRTRMADVSALLNECSLLTSLVQSGGASDEIVAHQFQKMSDITAMFSEMDSLNELDGLMKDGLYGIEQISEIVINLKNFSRLDRAAVAEFNVNSGLDSTLMIAKSIVKTKKIKKMYGDVAMINCSPSQINQIFLNLITNAAQATGADGEITLITKQQGDQVKIEVLDNGKGIPAEILPNIFDPFFTTKKVGEGTGLGLSIVQRIINDHGGQISVHSEVGRGTKFTILLPVQARAEQREPEPVMA